MGDLTVKGQYLPQYLPTKREGIPDSPLGTLLARSEEIPHRSLLSSLQTETRELVSPFPPPHLVVPVESRPTTEVIVVSGS